MKRRRASLTAEVVCALRGAAGIDPMAPQFLGPAMRGGMWAWRRARALGLPDLSRGLEPGVVARHRYIDEALLDAVGGGARQVVLLGAGYDARFWRFADALRDCALFEVDHPATAAARADRATRLPDVGARRVAVDFEVDDFAPRLEAAGFDRDVPAFFVWEGVSMYLPRGSVVSTLGRIGRLAARGSRVGFDLMAGDHHDAPLVERLAHAALRAVGEPLVFGVAPADAGELVGEAGLRVLEVTGVPELCGRWGYDPGHRSMYLVLAEIP